MLGSRRATLDGKCLYPGSGTVIVARIDGWTFDGTTGKIVKAYGGQRKTVRCVRRSNPIRS